MFSFRILKKSAKSRARLGILKARHGEVETPCLVPVATRAAIKAVEHHNINETGTQMLIANAFHLHLKPGEAIIKRAGGIHKFMNWQKPIMTDSGGFQVFSLGFGRDFGLGKIYSSNRDKTGTLRSSSFKNKDSVSPAKTEPAVKQEIKQGAQPAYVKITDEGALFRSQIDGTLIFLGPKESIKIQEKIGADIIFAFDECTPPLADFDYARNSLLRTNKWAKICLKTKKTSQALFGIVQGSRFKRLREESARFINSLDFEGFGIGGDLGKDKKTTLDILDWTIPLLNEQKPRHLLGIGKIEDIELIIKSGIDLFDCTVPTQYARRGIAFISSGKINLKQSKFLKEQKPIDSKCSCRVCKNYTRSYISHLFRAGEITGLSLLSFHNLYFFNAFIENIKQKIKKGTGPF